MWTPRYNPRKPVSFEALKSELRTLHANIRQIYEGKDVNVLEIYIYMIRFSVGAILSSHCGSASTTINFILMMCSNKSPSYKNRICDQTCTI